MQRDAPHAQRGRVLSILQALVGFSYGIGILWLGVLGDATSLRIAFATSSSLLTVSILILVRRMPDWRHSIDVGSAPVLEAAPA